MNQKESFQSTVVLNASAERIYTDWLSSSGHSNMTGGEAVISDKVGEEFNAWDEYISGRNIDLVSNKKIVQKWRTVEFPENADDSDLTIELKELDSGRCELTLTHSNLELGDGEKYRIGWEDHYFTPMKAYYG